MDALTIFQRWAIALIVLGILAVTGWIYAWGLIVDSSVCVEEREATSSETLEGIQTLTEKRTIECD